MDDNGVPTDPDLGVYIFRLNRSFASSYILEYESEQVAANWVVEVESLDGKLLHRQVFNTVLPAMDEASSSAPAH